MVRGLNFRKRQPSNRDHFTKRVIPNSLKNSTTLTKEWASTASNITHSRRLRNPSATSLGYAIATKSGVAGAASSLAVPRSNSTRAINCPASSSTPAKDRSEVASALSFSLPLPPHSCGGKGWDMNNPCHACIRAALS